MDTPITPQQVAFFRMFGYVVLPGLLRDDVASITAAFEEVFRREGTRHDGKQRSVILRFIDRHERLRALLDDPRIEGLCTALAGEGFNYVGSDGNYYVGDTRWHCDTFYRGNSFLKMALYLDPVGSGTGALSVIPGSHLPSPHREAMGDAVTKPGEVLGIEARDVPARPLVSQPGDVVCFDQIALHAAFGGSTRRRMFTLNFCGRYPEGQTQQLRHYLSIAPGGGPIYARELVETAGPERMRHLEQVLAVEEQVAAEKASAPSPSEGEGGRVLTAG